MASFRKLIISTEDDTIDAGPAPDPQEAAVSEANLATDIAETADDTAAMGEAQATLEEIDEAIGEAQDVLENVVEPAAQGDGMTEGESMAVETLMKSIRRRGLIAGRSRRSSFMPAKEQFGNRATRRHATKIAKESVLDSIKDLWERFKKWISQMWEKVKSWFGGIVKSASGMADGFKTLKEKLLADKENYRPGDLRNDPSLDKMVIGDDVTEITQDIIEGYMSNCCDVATMEKIADQFEVLLSKHLKTGYMSSTSGPVVSNRPSTADRDSEYILNAVKAMLSQHQKMGFKPLSKDAIKSVCREWREPDKVKEVNGYGILPGSKVLIIYTTENGSTHLTQSSADNNNGKRSYKGFDTKLLSKLCDIGIVSCNQLAKSESFVTKLKEHVDSLVKSMNQQIDMSSSKAENSDNAATMTAFNDVKSNLKFANDLCQELVKVSGSGAISVLSHSRTVIVNAWHSLEKS